MRNLTRSASVRARSRCALLPARPAAAALGARAGLPAACWIPASHRSRGCCVAIVLLCAGCGVFDRNEEADPAHADSAGVEIVRNADDRWPRGELVQPAKRVFGSEADGPELFGSINNARLHRNGSLWIAEQQTQEIRVFDSSSGMHLFTIGGRGDGPGEFRRSSFIGFDAEGTAYVYDYGHRRLSVFSENGEFQSSDLMPSSLGIGPRPLHVTRTGTLLGRIPRGMGSTPVDGSTVRDKVRIWTMPLDGKAPNLVLEAPGALWYFRNGTSVVVPYTGLLPPPYAGGLLFGFWDDRVLVTDDAGEASFSVYGPAGLERRVEIDRAPRQIDGFSATMFVEQLRRFRLPESSLEIYEKNLSDMPIPKAQRPWDALVVTDQGDVWLLRTGGAEEAMASFPADDQFWDVFDAEGVFIGDVRLPSNVRLAQVSGQSALIIVSDDLGRVRVAIHDVTWIG